MSSLNFQADPHVPLIGDASVIINLIATGSASEIIASLPHPLIVTENARSELREGARKGHDDYSHLTKLIESGLVVQLSLNEVALPVYEKLIDGSNARTLDDGEAATIACALILPGIPLLDERKARSLCSALFPDLPMLCSAELLMHEAVAARVGPERRADLVFNALKIGRMRVPSEYVERIVRTIGEDRAAECTSLPKNLRRLIR